MKILKIVTALSACVLPEAFRDAYSYKKGGNYGFTLELCCWTSVNDNKSEQLPACWITHECVK